MRQRILIALAVLGVLVALVVGVGAGGDNGGDYRVRAIFDNAAFAIPGEDVMIAGASDMLCQITFSGFNALRLVDEEPCRFSGLSGDAQPLRALK